MIKYIRNLLKREYQGQESPSAEKLVEIPSYEPTNGVFDKGNRIPTTVSKVLTHPDSFFYSQENKSENISYGNVAKAKQVRTGSPDNLEETLGVGAKL